MSQLLVKHNINHLIKGPQVFAQHFLTKVESAERQLQFEGTISLRINSLSIGTVLNARVFIQVFYFFKGPERFFSQSISAIVGTVLVIWHFTRPNVFLAPLADVKAGEANMEVMLCTCTNQYLVDCFITELNKI